jgi:hypothetical protein
LRQVDDGGIATGLDDHGELRRRRAEEEAPADAVGLSV